jgi:hypothetical protein
MLSASVPTSAQSFGIADAAGIAVRAFVLFAVVGCQQPPRAHSLIHGSAPVAADPVVDLFDTSSWGCATRYSGHVDCWNKGERSQRLPELHDVLATGGTEHVRCVLRRSKITCTKLGEDPEPPVDLPIAGAIALHIGYPSCAILADHRVTCWEHGAPAQRVAQLEHVVALTGNLYLTCAIRSDGTVSCADEILPGVPLTWRTLAIGRVRTFAVGIGTADNGTFYSEGCAVIDDGSTRCFKLWGEAGGGDLRVEPAGLGDLSALHGASRLVMDDDVLGDTAVTGVVAGSVVRVSDGSPAHLLPGIADAVTITPRCVLRAMGSVVCRGAATAPQPPGPVPGLE